jgi:hypothetical protein
VRTNRAEKRYECHKCDFHRTVQVGQDGYNYREQILRKARSRWSIVIHYLEEHLSLTKKDTTPHISNNAMLCYSCPSCAFQTQPIDPQSLNSKQLYSKKKSSMGLLFDHCKTVHDDGIPPSRSLTGIVIVGIRAPTLIQLAEDARLKEGEDYFKCPQEGCPFFVSCLSRGESLPQYIHNIKKIKHCRKNRKFRGQSKLGRHFIEQHDIPPGPEVVDEADHRRHCEQILRRNTDSFHCSRCEYTTPWLSKSRQVGYEESRCFFRHYAAHHLIGKGKLSNPLRADRLS